MKRKIQHRRHRRRKSHRKFIRPRLISLLFVLALFFFAIGGSIYAWFQAQVVAPVNAPTTAFPDQTKVAPVASDNETATSPEAATEPESLPAAWQITGVAFVPQAPEKIWDEIHEETCEEAAILTVHYYLQGIANPSISQIEHDLQAMIAWEKANLATWEDTTASQTAQIISEYLGYGDRVRVIDGATIDDLKREISDGRPVIVPTAGRLLGNPHFKSPGPVYHMVVATGFNATQVITHDPGTQFGANYRYPIDTFWNAVHDFVNRTDASMATGAKRLIVID